MSDADRDLVADRLRAAAGDGRLSPEEVEQRLAGVLAARTFGEAEPYVADLPGGAIVARAPDEAVLRTTATTLKRRGRWTVARRLLVTSKWGSVKLDFTEAAIPHQVVEIVLDVWGGWVTLTLPPDASVNVDGVDLVATPAKVYGVPADGGARHFVVRGVYRAGRLVVRNRRPRFLWWRR